MKSFARVNTVLLIAFSALCVAEQDASAVTIVSYNLSGAPGDQAFQAPASAAPNVTGLNMTRGSGLGVSTTANSFNTNSWNNDDEPNEYVSFGFNVAGGFAVDLQTLTLATFSTATGPGTMGLYYSVDGFANVLHTFNQPSAAFLDSIVDLSALPNLTGAVEFRIREIGNLQADGVGTPTATGAFRILEYNDNGSFLDVQFAGTVIPEPSTTVLAGIGMITAISLKRRRKALRLH